MIVPMKKVTLVLLDKTREQSLKILRQVGLLHIQPIRDAASSVPKDLMEEAALLERALNVLPKASVKPFHGPIQRSEAALEAQAILDLVERKGVIQEELSRIALDRMALKPWGDFDPAELHILDAQGIHIRLVKAKGDMREILGADPECDFVSLFQIKGLTYGAVVYRGNRPQHAVEGISLPEYGLTELERLATEGQKELTTLETRLAELAVNSGSIKSALEFIRQEIEFYEVQASLSEEEGLAWFTGFIPEEDVPAIKQTAADSSWGIIIRDPDEEDHVPSLVRNSPMTRMIQPVFSLMGIFPGYREVDISLWFLIFLSCFTAMIIGDAAYGFIILGLVCFGRIKLGRRSDVLRLLTLFGITTIIWGSLTGTWFSSLAIVRDVPLLRRLVVPALATYQQELFPGYVTTFSVFPGDSLDAPMMVQWISLLFGIVMLSIARIQSFIIKLPSLKAIAQLGWLFIVLGLYWLIMQMVLQLHPLPIIMDLIKPMIFGGMGLVLVFGGQEKGKSFGKGLLAGLQDLLPTSLNAIGAFGDIISFIRLFAVGLAGVALAQSFNAMAPWGSVLAIIAAVIILSLGHTLNLTLNALSVLVHGVRLNVLEFSGHLDMEWAGFGFEPFRLRVPESETPETDKESIQ